MYDHSDVATPHCIVCGSELHSSNFALDGFGDGITLYACQKDTCSERNKYVQRYVLRPHIADEPIFKPKQ